MTEQPDLPSSSLQFLLLFINFLGFFWLPLPQNYYQVANDGVLAFTTLSGLPLWDWYDFAKRLCAKEFRKVISRVFVPLQE
jgi:hypothetical protein